MRRSSTRTMKTTTQQPRPSRLPLGNRTTTTTTSARQSFPRASKPVQVGIGGGNEVADGVGGKPSSKAAALATKSVRFEEQHVILDKENTSNKQEKFADHVVGAQKQRSSGISQFRQRIRATLSPKVASRNTSSTDATTTTTTPSRQTLTLTADYDSTNATTTSAASASTPFSLIPISPHSLLLSEMDRKVGMVQAAGDESLLSSPETVVKETTTKPFPLVVDKESQLVERPHRQALPVAKQDSMVSSKSSRSCSSSSFTNNPPLSKAKPSSVDSTIVKKLPPHEIAQQLHPVHPYPPTPMSTPGGICLDLSHMFSQAKQTPHASTKPWKRPPLPNGHTNKQQPQHQQQRMVKVDATPTPSTIKSDEWSEKQCETITMWLNYVIQPSAIDDGTEDASAGGGSSAIRTLSAYQQTTATRLKALKLFDQMKNTLHVLQEEIVLGRLALRKDQNIFANLTLRNKMLDLLMQYSTPWLRLGLETLFGQAILPSEPYSYVSKKCNDKTTKQQQQLSFLQQTLKKFIVQRVLSDEATLAKYTKGRCSVPSGKFEIEYHAELRKLVLFRIMMLLLFLDSAKKSECLLENVTLFHSHSIIKSSKDVLLAFCREFLSGEGSLIRHLSRLGLSVTYQQDRLEEVMTDFTITNLASDLRDGVRLARLAEILTGVPTKSILSTLRLPATSRLQKLHNVGVALEKLQLFMDPSSSGIAPHHIVDGHREIVLKLLWWVVAQCCLDKLVNVDQIQAETGKLERLYLRRGHHHHHNQDEPLEQSAHQGALKDLLFRWCRAVTRAFGLEITNLTNDFADGKVFCFLVSYYHPLLLQKRQIKRTTRDLPSNSSHEERSRALLQERSNALLANSRMNELGGIHKMVPICDSSCPPDEKSVILCLSFMWSRLMESKGMIRSSVVIQTSYRKYRSRVIAKKKQAACKTILRVWRERKDDYYRAQKLRYGCAVRIIERFAVTHRQRLAYLKDVRLGREQLHKAAIVLQANVRSFLAKSLYSAFLAKIRSVVVCQSRWRLVMARQAYQRELQRRDSSLLIQKAWRRYRVVSAIRNQAAVTIQRVCRGFWALVQYNIDMMDIVAVQCWVRRNLAMSKLRRRKWAARVIQTTIFHFRIRKARYEKKLLAAALFCQSALRRRRAMQEVRKRRQYKAVTEIQAHWRRHMIHLQVTRMLNACSFIQAIVRGSSQRRKYVLLRLSCLRIQSSWRRVRAQRLFAGDKHRIVYLQKICRSYLAHLEKERRRKALVGAITIQSFFRGLTVRSMLSTMHDACRRIQAIFRGHKNRAAYLLCRDRTTRLQATIRTRLAVQNYKRCLFSVQVIQNLVRCYLACGLVAKRLRAIVSIQCAVRCMMSSTLLCSLQLLKRRRTRATVTIQRYCRGFVARSSFHDVLWAGIQIQSAFRRWRAHTTATIRRESVGCLQRAIRMHLADRFVAQLRSARELELLRQNNSALKIQSLYRGYLLRRELLCLHVFALLIQRNYRSFRCWLNYQMDRVDIIIVQTLIRTWKAEKMFLQRKRAVVLLQAVYRGQEARKFTVQLMAARKQLLRQHVASTVVQRVFRGHMARREASRQAAARVLQKTWRCFTVHVDYMLCILSVLRIQPIVRGFLCRRQHQEMQAAVVRMNSVTRGFLCRLELKRKKLASRVIQATYRRHSAQSEYRLLKTAALVIQCVTRGTLARFRLARESIAASKIQSVWRGFAAFREYVWLICASIAIQSGVRAMLARSRVKKLRLDNLAALFLRKKSSVMIQRQFREYAERMRRDLAARKIQVCAMHFLFKAAASKLRSRIVRFQSMTRRWLVCRRRATKIVAQARRVHQANIKAQKDPKQRIGYRTKAALNVLLRLKRLSALHAAIRELETTTRLSKKCCENAVEAGACNTLFALIRNCNRSLPHIELLTLILWTLSNIGQYGSLMPALATATSVEIFLDLIQMFRDKDEIFYLASSLLERVLRCNRDLESLCSTRENLRRLNGVMHVHLRQLPTSGGGRLSMSRNRISEAHLKTTNLLEHDLLREGIKSLKRVIHLVSMHK